MPPGSGGLGCRAAAQAGWLYRMAMFAVSLQAAAEAPNYRVDVVNHSGFGLDEVDLAVARFSDPVIRLQTQRHVVSGATAAFDLGSCSDVRQFAASAFIGNREVLHTADINPSPSCHTEIEITHT
ncbi:hypothetical protein ACFYOD_33195 [Streptomyces sp. NPDC006703]|uniref:hypothetical protein n=1 Tax=Streptomyces sp. NPDC006703 TaxID=3364759 RepID=UPI003681DFEC